MTPTSTNQESGPPLHVLLEIGEAAADMTCLVLLNASWTAAAERGYELGDRDREALFSLGNKIDAQLATVERHAHTLSQTYNSYHVWINESVADALASEQFTDAQREDIRGVLKVEDDDFAGQGVAAAELLMRRVPIAREELRSNILALRQNGPIVTIMDHATTCAILASTVRDLAISCAVGCGPCCAEAGVLATYGLAEGC
jgi:hypothetical protein